MIDEIGELRLFVRIVTAGSLSEAARRTNSSLPAVSRRLAAMEERIGVRLIHRSTRRFALTEEGNLLYERAVSILAEIDETVAELSARTSAPAGHLRIGTPQEIGRRRFAPLIAEFSAQYPSLTVELALSDSPVDVISEDLDVGFLVDRPTDGNVVARTLISSRIVLCASPDYLARRGTPRAVEDLQGHDFVCLVRGRQVFDHWELTDGTERREVRAHAKLLTNNAEVLHEWVLNGQGVGAKALWDVESDLESGRLIELLAPLRMRDINLYAIYRTRTHVPRRIRLFLDFITAAMNRNPGGG